MRLMRVSDATWHMLAGMAILPFRSTGTRQPDGSWLVPVEDDTWERLEQHRLAGESRACPRAGLQPDPGDDVVARVLRAARGRKPS